jgi:hypothetical protein
MSMMTFDKIVTPYLSAPALRLAGKPVAQDKLPFGQAGDTKVRLSSSTLQKSQAPHHVRGDGKIGFVLNPHNS